MIVVIYISYDEPLAPANEPKTKSCAQRGWHSSFSWLNADAATMAVWRMFCCSVTSDVSVLDLDVNDRRAGFEEKLAR